MSSSTFEVIETENENEKVIDFGIEACEENGIALTQVDGEIQKDHTYTKDPDVPEGEENEVKDEEKSVKKEDSSPEKKTVKKSNSKIKIAKRGAAIKNEKSKPAKKETPANKKVKTRKEILSEESNKTEDASKTQKAEEKAVSEEPIKPQRRGKKRKIEEKENVIDQSIVEEVQNISESDPNANIAADPPVAKKESEEKPKEKKGKVITDAESVQNLPKGWVRKVVVRKSGKTAGQTDIYIYSPDGIKFRSKPDVAAYLARTKSNLKIDHFNFSKRSISEDEKKGKKVKKIAKKEKATPSHSPSKAKSAEKKKAHSNVKKSSKLVVKLNFSPKNKKGKNLKGKDKSKTNVRNTKASVKNKKKT